MEARTCRTAVEDTSIQDTPIQDPSIQDRDASTHVALKRSAATGLFWATVETWGRQIVSLGIFVLITKILEPYQVGLFMILMVAMDIGKVAFEDAVAETVVQRPTLTPMDLDSIFWATLAGALVTGVVLASGLDILSDLAGYGDLQSAVWAVAAMLVLYPLASVPQGLLRRNLQMRLLAMRTIGAITVAGIVGLVLAVQGYGLWALIGQYATERVVSIVVLWWGSSWRPHFRVSRRYVLELFPFFSGVAADRIIGSLQKGLNRLLIGALFGPAILGLYTVAARILDTALGTFDVIPMTWMSVFSRLQHDVRALRTEVSAVLCLAMAAAFPIFAGLGLLSPSLIPLLLGDKWQRCAILLQIACASAPALVFCRVINASIIALGHSKIVAAMAGINVLLNAFVLAVFGGSSVEMALTAIAVKDWGIAAVYFGIHKTYMKAGTRSVFIDLAKTALSAAAMLALTGWVFTAVVPRFNVFMSINITIAAGVVSYSAALAAVNFKAFTFAARCIRKSVSSKTTKDENADEHPGHQH